MASDRKGMDQLTSKQWVQVESCNVAVRFEESWPNPTDAPEEAGTQIQLLAGELMLPLSR